MPYTDTLQIYDVLRKEFDESKAKTIAASIETALESSNNTLLEKIATKEDITNLRVALKSDITTLRADIKNDMANLRAELKTEMANQKAEIIRMNFLFWLGLIPVMAALIKFIR